MMAYMDNPDLQGLFDNRATWCREYYNKGKLASFITAEVLLQKGAIPYLHKDWAKPWGAYHDRPTPHEVGP